ncbi:MAG: N,N-dimethylformamidase beta subunit family domain-containing protein, partial [Pseudomonadota bacterium]
MGTEQAIAGYCWPQSAKPGETITLYCHTIAKQFSLAIIRQGGTNQTVQEQTGFQGVEQVMPEAMSVEGCAWQPSVDIKIESNWPSGFYLIELTAEDGATAEAFFVVRSEARHDAMFVVSTSTWAAYNDWGGPSFYTGGHISNTHRPLPPGFLKKPDPMHYRIGKLAELTREQRKEFFEQHSYWCMASGWCNQEILFVRWAEQQGITLDYAVSHDLDIDADLLTDYPAYISVGHDEYWSKAMRDNVENYVETGGHAAFFSGNTSFWQVRFQNDYSQVVGYKLALTEDPVYGTDEQSTLSTMWSDPLVGRPENEMTGVSFTHGGYAHMRNAPNGSGGYTVWRPEHWAFEGVGLRSGDLLGAEPAVVVAYECDGCELGMENGLPYATGNDGTPANFTVLGTAPAHLWETQEGLASGLPDDYIGELNWVAERLGGADMPQVRERYTHGQAVLGSFEKGSGEVFTTGCTDWAYGLSDEKVQQVTMNVLKHFGVVLSAAVL